MTRLSDRACKMLERDTRATLLRCVARQDEDAFMRLQLNKRLAVVEHMAEALSGSWPDGRRVELNHRDDPHLFVLIMFRDHEYDARDLDLAVFRAFALRRERAATADFQGVQP